MNWSDKGAVERFPLNKGCRTNHATVLATNAAR